MACQSRVLALSNATALISDLLAWFEVEARDLPWRQSADLYGIWVSEIMLQQTTVQAVIPFWERFMARFPTVSRLANASESEVLQLWSGLGYYSRARHLHAAAQIICRDRAGQLPRTCAEWQSLPGVGPYAGGAIASIGLGEAVPALDANARRVLLRWATTDPQVLATIPAGQRNRLVDDLGAELVPPATPGAWNEAVMELGALICGARRADCRVCPVQHHCNAQTGGWVDAVPPPKKKISVIPVEVVQLLVVWRDRVLFARPAAQPLPLAAEGHQVARADFSQLHRGLWGLPMTPWLLGDSPPEPDWPAWRKWLGLPAELVPQTSEPKVVGHFIHGITRYRLRVSVVRLDWDARREMPPLLLGSGPAGNLDDMNDSALFFPAGTHHLPLSKLAEKGLHFHLDTVV